MSALYSEDAIASGISHEFADLIATTLPLRLQEERWRLGTQQMQQQVGPPHRVLADSPAAQARDLRLPSRTRAR